MKKFAKSLWTLIGLMFYGLCTNAAHLKFAITQNPVIGRARGTAGGMVFLTLFGENVMKALPVSYADLNSPAQQAVRAAQKICVKLCSGIKASARSMFATAPVGMSSYSKLLSQIQLNFLNGATKTWKNTLELGSGLNDIVINSTAFTTAANGVVSVIYTDFRTICNVLAGTTVNLIFLNLTTGASYNVQELLDGDDIGYTGTFPASWEVGDDVACMIGVFSQMIGEVNQPAQKHKAGSDLANKVK
jgi:hypothetical protein